MATLVVDDPARSGDLPAHPGPAAGRLAGAHLRHARGGPCFTRRRVLRRLARVIDQEGRVWRGPSVLLLGLLLAALACDGPGGDAAAPHGEAPEEPVVEVVTDTARLGSIRQHVSAPGSLVARRESRIGAEVRGRITRVHVAEGDRVRAGDPLFEVDPERYVMAVRQAQTERDVARAERRQIAADLARARALGREDVLSDQEIERLATSLSVAEARERRAEQGVALAEDNLERTVIRAPYDGSVAARLADEGTTAELQPQTVVVVLQETAHLEAHAAIPESQLSLVRLGDTAFVHVEGVPEPIRTTVSAVSDSIDEATRTYLVKMPVENPERRLKAGVFAHVEIAPAAKGDTLLVPRDAVRTEDGRTRVLMVREGRAASRAVEIGLVSDEMAEVLDGLAPGDEVVVGEAARSIAPGMRIRVVPGQADVSS